jgi:hypothetical protein
VGLEGHGNLRKGVSPAAQESVLGILRGSNHPSAQYDADVGAYAVFPAEIILLAMTE